MDAGSGTKAMPEGNPARPVLASLRKAPVLPSKRSTCSVEVMPSPMPTQWPNSQY
jgi:hypothetical protein